MNGVNEKYSICRGDYADNLLLCETVAVAGYYLADCSVVGLALELASLAASVVFRDSLSCKITNFVSVDTTVGVSLAMSRLTSGCSYIASSGNTYMVEYSEADYELVQKMFRFDIFAKKWAETQYLGYLNGDKWGFDDDHFIKHDADSDVKATNNINKLNQLLANY